MSALQLRSNFAQLAFELANEGQPEEEMLSVILNSFSSSLQRRKGDYSD